MLKPQLFLFMLLLTGFASYSRPPNPTPGNSAPDAVAPGRNLTQLFGRIWQAADGPSKPAFGSIYIFLANGTLLETSCVETYRIAKWTTDGSAPSVFRVVEDGQIAFTAEITELTRNTLRLRQTLARRDEKHDVRFKAVEHEFVCPDLPK